LTNQWSLSASDVERAGVAQARGEVVRRQLTLAKTVPGSGRVPPLALVPSSNPHAVLVNNNK